MTLYSTAIIMVGVTIITMFIPFKFDREISSVLYYGYEDLEVEKDVIKKGNFYNFGYYSLRMRYLTLDIESIGKDKVVWSSPIDQNFISCASHNEQYIKVNDYKQLIIDDTNIMQKCKQQVITNIKKVGANSVLIEGTFRDCQYVYYSVQFNQILGKDGQPKLEFNAKCSSDYVSINRIYFRIRSTPFEAFYGLGEQFSYTNLKGKIFNTLVREKGIGRGDEPITSFANAFLENSGGRYANTQSPSTMVVSTYNRSIYLDTNQYSIWDFQDDWSVNIFVCSKEIKGQIFNAPDMKKLLTRVTEITGRMKPLPDWIQKGAVFGIEGKKLLEMVEKLERNDIPIAGFFIQDWSPSWNWELDELKYPIWNQTVQRLLKKDIRIMTYINPMFMDVPEQQRNLYREAAMQGYLIHDNQTGRVHQTRLSSNSSAGLLDLSNPNASIWFKTIIKENILQKTNVYGFMADFGETSPVLNNGINLFKDQDIIEFHQQYPVLWQKLISEAIKEYVQETNIKDEFVFFTKSGYTNSPNYTRLMWAGDQNQNWGRHNGIKSALVAMISSGFSGLTLTHSDVGGQLFINNFINDYFGSRTLRDKDLLIRWMELSAFSCVFRTHEGSMPDKAVQPYDSQMLHYLKRNTFLFKLLGDYRKTLMDQAYRDGLPVMRALVIEFQSDPNVIDIIDQFMFGSELMVAPILEPNTYKRKVYFPRLTSKYNQNFWINVWSEEKISGCECYKMIDGPYNEPPVFQPVLSNWDFGKLFSDVKKIK